MFLCLPPSQLQLNFSPGQVLHVVWMTLVVPPTWNAKKCEIWLMHRSYNPAHHCKREWWVWKLNKLTQPLLGTLTSRGILQNCQLQILIDSSLVFCLDGAHHPSKLWGNLNRDNGTKQTYPYMGERHVLLLGNGVSELDFIHQHSCILQGVATGNRQPHSRSGIGAAHMFGKDHSSVIQHLLCTQNIPGSISRHL